MTGWGYQNQNPLTQTEIQNEQNMQNAGQQIWQNLQSGTVTCQQLTTDDFEKLGEYFMGQAAGSTQNHVYWDRGIENMMGVTGDTNMHIAWGERGSGCLADAAIPSNTPSYFWRMMDHYNQDRYPNQTSTSSGNNSNTERGGDYNMMWGYGAGGAAGWGAGFGVFWFITWLVVLVDLILLGVWLFKKIQDKK